ncbi:trans-sulfuration enzyme family protein [Algibacter aquimarinus]|uniref:Cystathionine gamma-synthase n=1 Tax=Algibacter aquimarinus TaxID=1136748 RepID=A0ABP9HQF7_9FLAO
MKFETLAIKSLENNLTNTNAVSVPIYLSTTFIRNEDGSYNNDFLYTRSNNPNRQILENSLALLEGGKICYTFSSGMAAISAIFQSFSTGDHILLPDDVYYNVYMLTTEVFERWGLEFTIVDMSDKNEVLSAIKDNTKLIWVETPSNPQLKITDIEQISEIAKKNDILLAVDNTWSTPVLLKPLDLGADIVMHSTTKYFGGHSDVLGGCVILKENNETAQKISHIQSLSGGVPSPFDCWLISRGIQTLHLRVTAQTKTAKKLAKFLEKHPQIKKVNYPGLKSHTQFDIAKKQMKNGYGAMLSVLIKGNAETAKKITNKLKVFTTATSLGGVESLVEHRKSVEGINSNTPENLLRISVGLENVDDLIEDWKQALSN